jgi:hypothetical protein
MNKLVRGVLTGLLILNLTFGGAIPGLTPDFAAADEGESTQGPPLLVIGKDAELPVLKAGEAQTLVIPVQNRGGGEANNVMVSLVVEDPATFPFVINRMTQRVNGPVIMGGSWGYIHYQNLVVAAHAESKIYTLPVLIEYKTESGQSGSATGNIFARVVNDKAAPDLKLTGVQLDAEAEKLISGETGAIQLRFRNEGNSEAQNAVVQLSGFSPEGFNLEQDLSTWKATKIGSKEVVFAPYKLTPHADMATGSYSLNVKVTYQDAEHKEYSLEEVIYLAVEGKDEADQSKTEPRLIISTYDYGGAPVTAGGNFTLGLTFFNTHASKDVSNITVNLSSDDNVFVPVGATNTFYIPFIAAGETAAYQLRLQPKITAETRNYSLTATINYEDAKGNKLTETQVVGLPVVQEVKLTVAEVVSPAQAFMYDRLPVTVDYYNTGRSLIRNLIITTEGNFDIANGTRYIGNLESGKSNYFDVVLTPTDLGKNVGRIIFSFEDEIGTPYQQVREFSFNVEEMPVMEDPGMDTPPPEAEGGLEWPWIVGGAAAVVLLALVFWFRYRRRRRAEEELEFDD